MLLLDVNVVLATHRDDHPHHARLRPWFDELIASDDDFGVPDPVWGSFLRLVTNRRIFPVPTPVVHAFAFVEATCAQAGHVRIGAGPRHLALLLDHDFARFTSVRHRRPGRSDAPSVQSLSLR